MAEKEKAVLIDLGTVRVREYDSLNVQVERLEDVTTPGTGEVNCKWRFKGYSNTVRNALQLIIAKDLLVDVTAVRGLKDYLNKVETSHRKVLDVMRQ